MLGYKFCGDIFGVKDFCEVCFGNWQKVFTNLFMQREREF